MVSAPFFYFLFFLSAPHDQPSQSMNTFADLSSEAIFAHHPQSAIAIKRN
jgi:hypothetical protein